MHYRHGKIKEEVDKKFSNALDKTLNNIILEVEYFLKSTKTHFSSVVKKDEDEAVIFDWRKAEGSEKYRLHYIKQSGNHMVEARPFIEASLDERLQYVVYIPKFIDNFTLFLKELRED